ncbi:MAG: hypothetical protein KBB54_03420 [Candidatus Pacebacteria bacterium]|nr:hypothetical protein [Candidatus Paceibacterota bacterium]MBP9818867.1 hypothetical protein [Candidatus Paceibacterota bacterium]
MSERHEQHENIEIGKIHPDFRIVTSEGKWAFNRFRNDSDGITTAKIRAGFDDINSLDNISLSAKIGINTDGNIPCKFILFVFGSDKQMAQLQELAERMPYSEMITSLGRYGRSIDESITTIINP